MALNKVIVASAISLCWMVGQAESPSNPVQLHREEPTWFAIIGNFLEEDADTVELNLADVQPRGHNKTMNLRVNLAQQRTMGSGEKYTSYKSVIAIDCANGSVFHIQQTRYVGPRWTGNETAQYFGRSRPMAFAGLTPNPKPKVLKAAC